uniref:Uncharacterized protein n=1 Tax=Myoviridae sp. cteo515 TaxID=2823550 RepID=A0A8S5LBI9_9CAUD|nr:MAG TPA: hypothetical protein [Myoviridae sp. cteo515]
MKEVSPMKAIRQKCLDCSCGSSEEVKKLKTVLLRNVHYINLGLVIN